MRGRGLTLVEILVALAVLGILSTLGVVGVTTSLRVARESRLNALAAELAGSAAELYRSHWSNPLAYERGEEPPGLQGLRDRAQGAGLTLRAEPLGGFTPGGQAYTGPGLPPLRRVSVRVLEGGRERARLVVEVGNPTPPTQR